MPVPPSGCQVAAGAWHPPSSVLQKPEQQVELAVHAPLSHVHLVHLVAVHLPSQQLQVRREGTACIEAPLRAQRSIAQEEPARERHWPCTAWQ